MKHEELRRDVVETARSMADRGLTSGTSGNVSARVPEGMLITPSAMPYEALRPADLVRMDLGGTVLDGAGRPSTEWRLHAAILAARPETNAIVHAHPTFATALACLRRDIPAFHYMVAVAGGDGIRCADYATFGSPELARLVVAALEDRRACLMANHGAVALGATPREALDLAGEVEALAAQYCRALQLGEPVLLTADQMAEALDRFRDYRP